MAVHDMLMAAGGSSAGTANWVDDVFSTYLYTGTGSTQTITNGIDLSTKGGLVWCKTRSDLGSNSLWDTVRGTGKALLSNETGAQQTVSSTQGLTAFNSNGFSVGTNAWSENGSGITIASWTFAKQEKFFDVVTYTGTGSARTVAHNLGSAPGCIIVKNITNSSNWIVYHRSTTATQRGVLNTINAFGANSGMWNDTEPTSTVFTVGTGDTNTSGDSFVAYLFAHNAGGFGPTFSDNVISCGSFTTDGSGNATVSLGYEPQWVLFKTSNTTDNWRLLDVMRGWSMSGQTLLFPNNTNADTATSGWGNPTATGFTIGSAEISKNYIYIAIRRPMKPPTTGTEVFSPNAYTASSNNLSVTTGFPVDLQLSRPPNLGDATFVFDRLRGGSTTSFNVLRTNGTNAESTGSTNGIGFQSNTGFVDNFSYWIYGGSTQRISWNFRRASTFFDEVCYTGTGSATTQAHNLTVVPEMMIVKYRTPSGDSIGWAVYHSALGNGAYIRMDAPDPTTTSSTAWNSTTPTSSVFTVGTSALTNWSTYGYVAYLFATCAGVSKVGSYTGTGTTQQINCGFSGGARFVLIKRTDSTGDWYVWDTARGIVSGNDPYLLMNSTAAETTSTDYIDPYSAGFEISSTAPAAINANGGSYIYLAIA